jgi:hypothetical protein
VRVDGPAEPDTSIPPRLENWAPAPRRGLVSLTDENIRELDIAVDGAFGMSGTKRGSHPQTIAITSPMPGSHL